MQDGISYVHVFDISRSTPNRHRFSVAVDVASERLTINGCSLLGPNAAGEFHIYGPSRSHEGQWREYVAFSPTLRRTVLMEALRLLGDAQ